MNIACVICSELFISGADVYFTQCGHVFHYHCLVNWLERSKSCPQCRHRVTEKTIHKAYFNVSNTGDSTLDTATLLNRLETANFSVTTKDKEIKNLREKNNKLKQQNEALRKEIKIIEDNERNMKSTMLAFKDQINYFKSKSKETDRLLDEIVKLKSTIKNMENVDAIINGTKDQVSEILKEQQNAEELAVLVASLKMALVKEEHKKRDTDYNLKKLKNDLSKFKKEYAVLQANSSDMKRELQQIKLKYQKERNMLKMRLKDANKNNIVVVNPEADLPQYISDYNSSKLDASHGIVHQEHDSGLNTTLSVAERVDTITHSNSPYLPVKTNFASFLDTKFQEPTKTPSVSSNKDFSVFSSKMSKKLTENKIGSALDEVIYNGLGGTQKEDIYPTTNPVQTAKKRNKSSNSLISSSKFRKLAPNTKIVEFINLAE